MQQHYVVNSRGNQLCVRLYQPEKQIKGFVVFHHGYGAFTALYDPVYQLWAEQGICVVAHDAQGFGESKTDQEKLHAYISDMQHLADDLIQIRKELIDPKQTQQPVPVFVGGQSMGGLVAALVAIRDQTVWQGLMLISPGLDAERTFITSVLEKLQGIALRLCPNSRIVPSPPFEQCTDVPKLLKIFRTNPLMDQGPMRVKTAKAFLLGFEAIRKGESTLTLPILLVCSPTDTVISVPAVKRFLGNVQSRDVTVVWVDGAMHEIFLGRFEAQSRLPTVHWLQQHT